MISDLILTCPWDKSSKCLKTMVIVAHPNLQQSRVNRCGVAELRQHPDQITVHELYETYSLTPELDPRIARKTHAGRNTAIIMAARSNPQTTDSYVRGVFNSSSVQVSLDIYHVELLDLIIKAARFPPGCSVDKAQNTAYLGSIANIQFLFNAIN